MSGGGKLGAAAVAVTMLAAAGHTGHHKGGGVAHLLASASTAARSVIPTGGSYTPQSWARALLRAEGLPRTGCNVGAIVSWERAEGGHWVNDARYNPLNTTMPEPGSVAIEGNLAGVQSYTSWHQGLRATVDTLNNGRYGPILAALHAGDSAQAVADAEASTPWGTGPFTATCL